MPKITVWPPLLRTRPLLMVLGGLFVVIILWELHHIFNYDLLQLPRSRSQTGHADASWANSTLGFQTIIALSGEDSSSPGAWRQAGLLAAAARTGLSVQIHQQRTVTATELGAFRSQVQGDVHPDEGSALAWIGHLEMLQYIIDHKIGTALIFEDDADWDVNIRSQLAPRGSIASAFRSLYGTPHTDFSQDPFGTRFDLLWLGHCGASKLKRSTPIIVEDESLLPLDRIRALWGFAYKHLGGYHREVFSHAHASCTYAYAVTLEGARKVLQATAVTTTTSQDGRAFDNALAAACKTGRLECAAITPELFHQMRRVGDTSLVDAVTKKLKGKGQEAKHHPAKDARFFTLNIKYSARCNAGRSHEDLVQCLPTAKEFKEYAS